MSGLHDVTLEWYNPASGRGEKLGTLQTEELLAVVHHLPLAEIGLSTRPDHEKACMPKIRSLVKTLEAVGELPPVIVHPSGAYFYSDDGYHRLHAYALVHAATVPAVVWFEATRD